MATHLVTLVVKMEDMDGTPEQSAEILMDNPDVLVDYIEVGEFIITDSEEE